MNGFARALCVLGLAASFCAPAVAPAGAAAPDPTTILSFSGTSTGSGYSRELQFDTPEYGRYVLRASTTGGTIAVDFSGNGCCYKAIGPTPTDYDLGGLGSHAGWTVHIKGDGAATGYSGTIEELPHLLTSPDTGTGYAGPAGLQFHYNLAVPGYVEPRLWDEKKREYRDFPGATLPAGSYTFTWDLRDSSGNQVPDGWYGVSVQATFDSAPGESIGQSVIVDTAPPTITLAPVPAQNHDASLAYSVCCLTPFLQAGRGQANVSLSVDGGPPLVRQIDPFGWDRYVPHGGWQLGPHTADIVATDAAGNTARAEARFTVTMPPRVPHPHWLTAHCGTFEVKAAVRGSKRLNRSLRRLAHAPRGDLFRKAWLIKQRRCMDLTGGLVYELAVLLHEQHGPKTVLAVFERARGAWSLKFEDTGHQIQSLDADGRDLDATLRNGRTVQVHWNGHRFVLRRGS